MTEMYFTDEEHPVLTAIMNQQCGTTKDKTTAFRLYLRLCEEKCLPVVEWHTYPSLNIIYIEAKEEEEEECATCLYIPIHLRSALSASLIRKTISELKHQWNDTENTRIMFAFCQDDYNFIYYEVENGCIVPQTAEVALERKAKDLAKKKLKQYVARHKDQLYKTAQDAEDDLSIVNPFNCQKEQDQEGENDIRTDSTEFEL